MTFKRLTDQQIRALACQNKIVDWQKGAIQGLIQELEKLGITVTRLHETT